MKKITFLVAIMMLTVSMAFSQIEATHLKQAKEFPAKHVLTNVGAALCDTVVPLSFMTGTCYDSLTLYYAAANPDSGFFTGECYYKFPALAMRYTATVGSTISDAFVMYAIKAGTTGNTSISIYSATGTGSSIAVGSLLGTSATIVKSAIDTTNFGVNFNNDYHFSTPVTLTTANYFVVLSIPTTFTTANYQTDALGVMDINQTCSAVDSAGWFKLGTTWYSMFSQVGNLDMMILPIVCSSTVGNQDYSATNITKVFPNPSNNLVNVVCNQNIESVKIINTIGQTVYENNIDQNYVQINTSEFKAGIYFVQVKNKDGITTKQLQVIR